MKQASNTFGVDIIANTLTVEMLERELNELNDIIREMDEDIEAYNNLIETMEKAS